MTANREEARQRARGGPAPSAPRPPAGSTQANRKPGLSKAHRKRISQAIAAATATVGLLVGITSLVDWIRGLDPEPQAEIDAQVSNVALRSRNEALQDYLNGTGQPTDGLSSEELAEEGLVFEIRVRFKGGTKAKFPTTWSLHNARHRAPLRDDLYTQPVGTFTPRSPNHARTWLQWVPYPPRPGRYFLRVTIRNNKRQPVDFQDSRAFTVARIPHV